MIALREKINEKVVALVSGGLDSMVLATLLHDQKVDFSILHINYQKRGEASDGDQALVEEWSRKHKILCKSLRVSYPGNGNFQEWAREVRYEEAWILASEIGATQLVTAHHFGDLTETFFINLLRGTGLDGLTPFSDSGSVLRPLIAYSKSELKAFAEKRNVPWRDDASNFENDFTRNKVRNTLLPLIEEIDPRFTKSFSQTQSRLTEINAFAQKQAEKLLSELLQISPERETMPIFDLMESPFLVQVLADQWGVPRNVIEKRLHAAERSSEIYEDYQYTTANGWLIKSVNHKKAKNIAEDEGEIEYLSKRLSFQKDDAATVDLTDKSTAVFDFEKLTFPLVIRPVRSGDFFYPKGFGKKKKVSDFLTDIKMPRELRNDVLVLESDKRIIWVVGHRQDQYFSLGNQMKMGYIARVF